jgi:hypothetical protein
MAKSIEIGTKLTTCLGRFRIEAMLVTCVYIRATVAVASVYHAFSNFGQLLENRSVNTLLTLVLEAQDGMQMQLRHRQTSGNVASTFREPVD